MFVQGLIKMDEEIVNIRCRKSDIQMVEKVVDEALAEFKELMKKYAAKYQNKEVKCKVIVDQGKYLKEFDPKNAENNLESCMGGVILHSQKGRIVCSNTLDERLQLVYAEALPDVRQMLFPSLKRAERPEYVEENHH
jgi:V-type H+-transporting ATPase subunit E